MQILDRQWRTGAALRGIALALLLTAALAGCGHTGAPGDDAASTVGAGQGGGTGPAASPTNADGAPGAADEGAPASDADLVSAVNPAPPGQPRPITVKFRIEARPVVGMPVKILLALTPADQAMIDHLHASLAPGEGLLVQSPTSFDLSDLKAGTPLYREVTVVPQQTGVLNLSATLLLQIDKTSEARTYSIPLIASDNSSNP